MAAWDPWEALANEPAVQLVLVPPGTAGRECGRCNGHRTDRVCGLYFPDSLVISMCARASATMRRSVLAEELAHHELGHRPNGSPIETARMELRARRLAARRLIPLRDLAEALIGAARWEEVAGYLDVDPDLVQVRVRALTDEDRAALFAWSQALTIERFENGEDVMR